MIFRQFWAVLKLFFTQENAKNTEKNFELDIDPMVHVIHGGSNMMHSVADRMCSAADMMYDAANMMHGWLKC